ncbi:hypothetical protein FPRO03_14239, partial [Fusarium proliferatum]
MDSISSNDQIEYLFHHIFLPPKLPGGDDMSAPNTMYLTNFVLHTLQRFATELGEKDTAVVQPVISMLQTMPFMTDSNGLDHVGVQKALRCLSFDNPVALFHIAAQNSGLLIRKTSNSFSFETFELSPTNAAVMATKGRLIRHFPDTATEISSGDFESQAFQEVLTNTLVKMSHQKISEAQPKARKAGKDHHEERETTDPRIVTELLTSILRGIGKLAEVRGICKNTREEISYSSSKLPWRRSPVWLLIRVGLQLTMSRLSDGSDDIYKRFMVYLMARVLLGANQSHVPSELLHIMMTKISCRLCKLEEPRNDKWLSTVRDVVSAASKNLKERWERICNHSEKQLDIASLSSIQMKDHLLFSIPEIDNFLASIAQRGSNDDTSTFSPTAHVSSLNAESLPVVRTPSDKSYVQFNLAIIESWVQYNLDQWIEKHLHEESVCTSLKVLLESYHSAAKACHSAHPEATSRMLLTIGEIWIATDKAALHNYPMLKEYDAEVPTEIWQALLFQSKADMIRLQRLETYLRGRKRMPSKPSVFRSFGDSMSFPVRYFQQTSELQSKKLSIEERAELDKQAKISEFNHLKERYNDLMQQHGNTVCRETYKTMLGVRYPIHDPYCPRCSLSSQANNLQITVHEWPLPTDTLKAQATVFELGIPHQFAEWRDVTFYFIHDVLSFKSFGERPNSFYPLNSYSALSPWCSFEMSRVSLLSEAKPHLGTHRDRKSIALSEVVDVCLDNGLVYRYFDSATDSFICPFTQSMAVSNLCTFKLPERAQALQPFLVRSWLQPDGETPNQVIASQYKCPRYMTLGEFKALTILPYGYRLQWMSILTQLAMPTLDFNQDVAAIFLLQVSLQAGPNLTPEVTREAHSRLADVKFGYRLLDNLSQAVLRIEKNWESHTALCSFTLLTTRFLSLASPELCQGILGLLYHCRTISYQWLKTLIGKVQDTVDDRQRGELMESALDVAMICVQTFHVDDKQLKQILGDPQQASLLVESSIVIQNATLANNENRSPLQSIMENRTKYALHHTRRFLLDEVIYRGNECLDLAIKRSWPDFSRNAEWSAASSTCYWLETNSGRRQVHFNLLTGELLVNGAPLTRLPREYNIHEDYGRLFGSMILDVMPSNLPGMRFSATRDLQGHTVHFGIQEQDLLVQLHKPGSTLDLIPSRLLKGIVPYQFSDGFSHWYHRETKSIEFCKIHRSWALNDQRNWRFIQDEGHWKLGRHGDTFLIAPSSKLAKRIAEIFNPLEAPLGLHLVYSTAKSATEIQIPNLRLEFLLRSGESFIKSRQFRDMHVDSNQFTGTLMGLKNKLVLSSSSEPSSRTILIPEGDVQHKMRAFNDLDKHTMVWVVHGSARRVQAYKLDGLLGRLLGSTKTESKLYLAYLHGLTSFCLPDPFIRRTGTEEALDILGSAIVRATSVLSETSYDILNLISYLSPKRSFYPRNEKVMQVVGWSSGLSYVSQDDRFYRAVCNLLAGSREINFLYPKLEVPDSPDFSSVHLVERAINRASRGHVAGFGAEEFTTQHDVSYIARTQGIPSDRGIRTQEIAYRIYHSQCYIIETVDPCFAELFYQLLTASNILKPSEMPAKSMMQYDSKWFQEPETYLALDWCRIHYAFHKRQDWLNKFELMAWIATVSYSSHHNPQITQALLMIAQCSPVGEVPLPEEPLYILSEGCTPIAEEISRLAENEAYPITSCPEASLPYSRRESPEQLVRRRERRYKENKRLAIHTFVDCIISQWPCPALRTPSEGTVDTYLRCKNVMASLCPKWDSWYVNWKFKEYLQGISHRLREVPVRGLKLEPQPERVTISPPSRLTGFISIEELFDSAIQQSIFSQIPKPDVSLRMTKSDSRTVESLTEVIGNLEIQAKLPYEHRYLNHLRQSLSNLSKRHDQELDFDQRAVLQPLFKQNMEDCTKHAETAYQYLSWAIIDSLTRKPGVQVLESVKFILEYSNYLPRVTPLLLLQQLRPSRFSCLPERWKVAIIEYAIAITAAQRAKRLVRFESSPADLLREVQNPGHETWEAWDHPEWLLLECESEIMIRNVQQQIAQKMISPPESENAVMQLNMGEGKSTVIVPMVATALADGTKIIRVIVAKPQAKQMHRMIVSKLSGLLDRPVYLLPFSRDIRMNLQRAEAIHQLVSRCRKEGGVLMVQPEHLLSLQLMELECQLSSNKEAAERLSSIRELFDHASRDIVDESDENFSVKFELIYTLGQQCSIEDSPSRWVVIQEVLGLVAQVAGEVKYEFSKSLEFDDRNDGQYPIVRFLQADAGEVVLDGVIKRICKTGMRGLPISNQPEKIRTAVYHYITLWKLKKADTKLVETSMFFDGAAIGRILLLRGLFAGGILAFALGQKRWRVNYGVDPRRETGTKLAVPFRAKDSPTPRSEFSHPDVVITLTCLSYYYGGLDEEALFSAFSILTKSDNASVEYHEWTRTAPNLPSSFRTLEGVNLRDRVQFKEEIYAHLHFSKSAIDYYLSHLVFSKEAKEFPHKLSASGWDLAKVKENPTTGFSGTNDSRYVLPTDIKQLDLPEQTHTNALVLSYLLQSQNGVTLVPQEARGTPFNSRMLLDMISRMNTQTRVILDVGAQVIDLTNVEFAKQWLSRYQDDDSTQAVVCFNEDDEIVVLDRLGKVEEFETSPFAEHMDQCLVFLDESHTRGTDLKLPPNYRAAVTLGAGLTKDRLVQACMRMRKLGKGQSVEFCVPWEIEQKIIRLKTQEKAARREIVISDVLSWVITETCLDLRKAIPLWLNQGARFSRHQEFWSKKEGVAVSGWAEQFLEDEAQTLDQRYRPRTGRITLDSLLDKAGAVMANELRARCDEFGLTELHTASLQEEQERELSPETEQERQVEKPPAAEPETHF